MDVARAFFWALTYEVMEDMGYGYQFEGGGVTRM
jgi:hypothetical protein